MQSLLIQDFKLFAPIRLNHKPAFAHLDTGASGSMLVSTEAEGMEAVESHLMQGGFGQRQVRLVRIGQLTFLDQEFPGTTAAVIDGAHYFADVPFPVSMTLGADILLARPLVLDFKRLWLGFEEGPFDPALSAFPLDCSAGLPVLTLRAGDRELQAILDTGAAYSLLNAAHAEALGLDLEPAYQLEGQDPAGGTALVDVHRLGELSVGDIPLGPCELVALDLSIIEQRLDVRVDFVLGANTLLASSTVWVLDKAGGYAYVTARGVNVRARSE